MELELFGTSLRGFRFFAAVTQGLVPVLTGLAARELGGKREAQLVAVFAVAIGGQSLLNGTYLQYTPIDYLWWLLLAYLLVRLLKSDNARWWVAIGAAIGLGMMRNIRWRTVQILDSFESRMNYGNGSVPIWRAPHNASGVLRWHNGCGDGSLSAAPDFTRWLAKPKAARGPRLSSGREPRAARAARR